MNLSVEDKLATYMKPLQEAYKKPASIQAAKNTSTCSRETYMNPSMVDKLAASMY